MKLRKTKLFRKFYGALKNDSQSKETRSTSIEIRICRRQINLFHDTTNELTETQIPAADQFEFNDVFVDKDQAYAEVERQAYYVAFPQPLATEIATGKKWYVPFESEVAVEGPVYVISRQNDQDNRLPEFSIIGKVTLSNCITMAEFHEENPDTNEHSELPFVLLFEDPVQWETPLPYITSIPFGQLPKSMREVLVK